MLPCFICGENADTGWIEGFPPAPDSQKLALCKNHDNQKNRIKVEQAWEEMLVQQIHTQTLNLVYQSKHQLKLLSIYFAGGSSVALPCLDLSVTEHESLKILSTQGEIIFFPLKLVRNYSLSPMFVATDADEKELLTQQSKAEQDKLAKNAEVNAQAKPEADTQKDLQKTGKTIFKPQFTLTAKQ